LFQTAAETLTTIAADLKHLGAEIGVTAVLHTWGQNLDHHPHVHCIVPGGGLSLDRASWVRCRPGFFLPVRVLSRLFRRLFLERLVAAFEAGELQFFGALARLEERKAFLGYLAPDRKRDWVVFAKQPFAGPTQVLGYLARYTHRVAIGNSRLVELTDAQVRFRWKDYRAHDRCKSKVMTLSVGEFMRRFLMHVLPDGFHRIRHYGLLANGRRVENLALCRERLDISMPTKKTESVDDADQSQAPIEPPPCPCCGGRMRIIETFDGTHSRPHRNRGFDSS
jgi:hypothetical protein